MLEREPPTLDEALSLATRLEALGFQNEDHHVVEDKRVKERQVRVVGAQPNDETKAGWIPSDGRVHELEGTVNELRRQIAEERKQAETWRQLVQQQNTTVGPPIAPWPAPVAAPVPPTVWVLSNAEYVQQPGSNARTGSRPGSWLPRPAPSGGRGGYRNRPSIPRDTCRLCSQVGHWPRECPNKQTIPSGYV